jgi:hypothetical protein
MRGAVCQSPDIAAHTALHTKGIKMTTGHDVTDRWAEMCRSAQNAGASRMHLLEAHVLAAMQECRRLGGALDKARHHIDTHLAAIEQLRARITPPDPVRGLTRAHGLHLLNEAGKLIPVDADFSVDEDEGVQVEYVWIGAHDVAGMFWASHAERLADQITARLREDAAEQRAEQRGEARKELRAAA